MRQKRSAAVLLVAGVLLLSLLGWYAAADTSPSGAVPAPAATAPPADESPAANTATQGLDNTRVVEAQPRVRRISLGSPPGAGVFHLTLDAPPKAISRAFLVYELAGVPGWTAASRSINGFPSQGGFGAVPASGTHLQIEEINPRWLRQGLNQIVFSPSPEVERPPSAMTSLQGNGALAPEGAVPYTVRNLRVVYLDATARPALRSLRISHPLQGESDDDGASIRGFVEPAGLPTGPAELFVDGSYVSEGIGRDGAFAVFVPRSVPPGEAWDVELEVVYPDGIRLQRTVHLKGTSDDERDAAAKDGDTAELDAGPATAKSLALGKARLNLTAGALDGKVKLSMRGLRHDDLPALDGGMTNVTPGQGGFRMGPHGLRFKKPVELSLPYDAALIPRGMIAEDVHTFFFDEEAGRWLPLPRLDAKSDGDVITSLTTHFTDFINATIAMPDEPSGANFSPNSLQELAKADPAAGIVQIAPPEGGPTGDAMLDFPLVVPPGRHGMQPELAVHYDSSAGDGWLGMGWDLRLPSIEISTLFGVPRYDGSERYLIDGEQLAPSNEPLPEGKPFVRRIEGSFERIVRHGSGPTQYSWEVTDKNGTRYLYGDTDGSRLLPNPQSGTAPNIFRWYLRQVIDRHGNTIDYTYFKDSGTDGEPWAEVYPRAISYSGGYYQVAFNLDDGNQRPDRLSSGRQGFKTSTRRLLQSVDVKANSGGSWVRRYLLSYRPGDFGKSLLASIVATGEDGAAELYHHNFTYFSATQAGNLAFGPPVSWGSLSSAAETQTFDVGAHAFVGVGDEVCADHVGAQAGGGGGASTTSSAFLDVNGDGLPDRLVSSGTVVLSHYDPANGQGGFSEPTPPFKGPSQVADTQQWRFDLGAGAHLAEEQAIVGVNWAWSHGNDDLGMVDVNGDGFPDLAGSGSVSFNDGSSFGGGQGMTSVGGILGLAVSGELGDVLGNFKLSDPLRELVLPYAGTVVVTGAVQKKEDGGDGVRVAIYQNGGRLWGRTIAAGDRAACVPAPGDLCGDGLALQVNAGDRLYFLANAIAKTDHDALLWAPRVAYTSAWLSQNGSPPALTDVTGRQDEREPYGARSFVFAAGDDFRLTGTRDAQWTAPVGGTVNVLGAIVKQVTPADVVALVEKKVQLTSIWAPLKVQQLAAADAGTFDMSLGPGDVAAKDEIRFRLETQPAGAGVDPKLIAWTPSVTYEGGTYCSASGTCGTPVCQADPVSGQQVCTIPGVGGGIPRDVITRQVGVQMDGLFPPPGNQPDNVLSGGYHGWFYGEWNGNLPFDESGLRRPKSKDDKLPYVAGRPQPAGGAALAAPVWTAAGFDLYLAAEGVKPSRQGRDAAGELEQANSTGSGVDLIRKTTSATVGIDASIGSAGGSLSCGASDTQLDLVDLNGDGYPDQVTGGSDLSTTIDGLSGCVGLTTLGFHPDGSVLLGDGRGGFTSLPPFSGLEAPVRRTAEANIGFNAGLGINVTRKDGEGNTKAAFSTMPSVGSSLSLSQTTTDLVDVNGDGLPDRVSMAPGDDHVTVRLNLGYRFGREEAWPLPKWQAAQASCHDISELGTGDLADLTSFGTFDVLRHSSSDVVNAGAAFGPIGGGVGTTLSRVLVDLVDVNGDGLPDHVARDQDGNFFVKINYGDHWGDEQTWSDSFDWSRSAADHHSGLFQCLDALSSSGDVNGNGSVGAPICIPLIGFGIQIEISVQASGADGGGEISFEDFDGDGLPDRILKGSDSTVYVKQNQAQKANLLIQVDRPLGGTISLEYKRQGNRVDHSDVSHRIDMPSNQWVLAATVLADGRGHQYRTEHDYFNDAFYDRAERESYGYARVQTKLPDGSTIDRHFHNQDFYSRHLMTEETVADASGNLFRVETMAYRGVQGDTPDPACTGPVCFPALVRESTLFYEAGGSKSTVRTWQYGDVGNVVARIDFGDDATTDDDLSQTIAYSADRTNWVFKPQRVDVYAGTGTGTPLRRTTATYDTNGEIVHLERMLSGGNDPQAGTPYSGAKNAAWTFTYDAVGNLASALDPNGNTTSITYDQTVLTYPTQVLDSFGYATAYAYDLKYGELTATTDENKNTISRTYDAFGRLTSVVGPDDGTSPALTFEYGPGAPVSWAVVHHKDVTNPNDRIDSSVFIDSLGRVLQTKEDAALDGGSGTSSTSGMRVSGPVAFDPNGRISSQGQPFFSSSPANQLVSVPAKNPTTFDYDVLDRVRAVHFPNAAITKIDYGFGSLAGGPNRFLTTRTDPNGRATRFYRDVRDNVLGVEQLNAHGDSVLRTTRYGYDALSQLTSVQDSKGSTTLLQYDTLGRNVVLDNPDAGRTEYRYDPAGNLGAKITANLAAAGQQIRYSYTLGRLDRISYPASPAVVFTYGAPGALFNRANRIATVTDESGTEERSYDKLGNVVQTVKTAAALNGNTPKGPYTSRFQFDSFGRLLSLTYPDGEQLTYGFDAGGQVKSVSGSLRGVGYSYLRHVGYDQFGERVRVVLGNGVETRYTFDSASRFLTQLHTTGAGRDLQNLTYLHDLAGTVQGTKDTVAVPSPSLYGGPTTQTFQYDDLYQLIGAQGSYQSAPNKTSSYTLSLAYDEVGDVVAKNQLHQTASGGGKPKTEQKTSYNWAYAYGGPHPHAPVHIGDRTFSYDRNGNQTGWTSDVNGTRRTIAWDEENRPLSVADNGQTTRFLYDAGGIRTNKAGQHGETIYVNRWFSIRNGNIASKHVFADDARVSTKVSPGPTPSSEKLYFYQPDHLGSAQFVTDEQGAAYEHLEYFPSGEIWVDEHSDTQNTPYLFSGKELDDETGLSYFGYRYYEARQGQWISADPILDGMLDTESLTASLSNEAFFLPGNIYGYVANSPLSFTDPEGLVRAPQKPRRSPRKSSPRKGSVLDALGKYREYPIGGYKERLRAGRKGRYDVGAEIYNKAGKLIGKGKYSSKTGVHAEIQALENALGKHGLDAVHQILVSKGSCRRCALVLSILGLADRVGPTEPSSTYSGAYAIPPQVRRVLARKLKGQDITEVVHTIETADLN